MSSTDSDAWMAYIDEEVRAVCTSRGLGHQLRRRAQERDRPVKETRVDGYEWKLITGERQRGSDQWTGEYYVLRLDFERVGFVLQHDTHHVSCIGPSWERETSTLIHRSSLHRGETSHRPPEGWLRDHLLALLDQFGPNHFSST